MQIKEKLEVFREFTIEAAKKEGGQMTAQYEAACQQEVEEFKKRKMEEQEQSMQKEERNIRRQANSKVSREMLRQKRLLDQRKSEWKEKLAEKVKELLAEYKETEEYQEYLAARIQKAKEVAGNDPAVIYLDPKDAGRKQVLEQQTGVALTISSIEFGGGIRAVIRSRNILIDESFATKLEQEETYL